MKLTTKLLIAACAGVAVLATGCKGDEIEIIVPPTVDGISGVEASYERGLHEYLEIVPSVAFENFNKENADSVKYEWSINYNVVSTDSVLVYKCDELQSVNGYLKVSTSLGAQIAEFTLIVTSPYDKGLVLLSSTSEGSMLSWKRLDKMATPVSLNAFKDNNPTLELGKTPLALCWRGECITAPTNASMPDDIYDIIVSSENPTKVYALNTNDLTVKNEIVYNGTGEFHPEFIMAPKGYQESIGWSGSVYFNGNGSQYIMADYANFVEPAFMDIMPDGAKLANWCAMVGMTDLNQYFRVNFNTVTKKLVYSEVVINDGSAEGTTTLNGDLIYLAGCDGAYYNNRIDNVNVLAVTANGEQTTVYRFVPGDLYVADEEKLSEIDASGKILSTSALAVNPIKPMLYYSNGNGIYRLNYDNESGSGFDAQAYITLDGNYAVKDMVFNPYDANTLYIAAENLDEESELKASIFIYDVTGNSAAELLFKGDKAGGSVKDLIYKGNGREYENIPAEGTTSLLKMLK